MVWGTGEAKTQIANHQYSAAPHITVERNSVDGTVLARGVKVEAG